MIKKGFKDKTLIVFDIDGTLTPSKAPADREMISLLLRLLEKRAVAVIGGGKYGLFKHQLVRFLPKRDVRLERFYLFPTSSTAFYRFQKGGWRCIYEHVLSVAEKKKIMAAFARVFKEIGYVHPKRTCGVTLEDRKTQISFSPLGQEIVAMLGEKKGVAAKEEWNRKYDRSVRKKMVRLLGKRLKAFAVRSGGLTTVDVTKKGIDKAYGIRQIRKELHIPIKKMLFVGDAIFPGGNDFAIVRTGVDYVKIKDPDETKRLIRTLIYRNKKATR